MAERDELDRLRALAAATDEVRPSDELTDAVMAALPADGADGAEEVDARLAQVTAATADLDATDALGDSVMAALEPADATLARAQQRTEDLRSHPDLTAAVMRAVQADGARATWQYALMRRSRTALLAAAAAAAASVAISLYTQSELDADVMAAVESVEVAE